LDHALPRPRETGLFAAAQAVLDHLPAGAAPWDIELTDLAALFSGKRIMRIGAHRSDFHTLFWITRGTGAHHVDFVDRPYEPATVLWTRPGAVQRFRPNPGIAGAVRGSLSRS
jgi:hypothetical protein